MTKKTILVFIRQLRRPVFTTHELTAASGRSASAVTQSLNHLERQGLIMKVYHGIWADAGNERVSPYTIMPFLFPRQRAYISFISALHLYGIIEQIPQVMTIASTSHSKTIRTKLGVFSIHQIAPSYFRGFDWYKKDGGFLIAEPEKALIDSLYLSARKKRQFGNFPELRFPRSFSTAKARSWAKAIPSARIRINVQKKLSVILENR